MSARRADVVRRRLASVAAVLAVAWVLTPLFPVVAVAVVLVDLVRLRFRLPLLRLASFGICWAWLEVVGVAAAAALWVGGRARDEAAHYRLQRWWANRLMASLRVTCGVVVDVEGVDALRPGPIVLLVRHASLADSLLTAWVVTEQAQLQPRVVLKRELLADPCLDIVGNRLPNCFLDRQAEDSAPGLAQLRSMGSTMGPDSAAIIFPEGTRANAEKRRRALERIGESDPGRAERLGSLAHLLPPRPSGTQALLEGAAEVDAGVVIGWHVGFDGLDTFAGILAALGRPRTPIRMRLRRVPPPPSTDAAAVAAWLDELWLDLDDRVEQLQAGTDRPGTGR
jgi:1-acyl-sn-glycerol-3-phosphate acyltransferase